MSQSTRPRIAVIGGGIRGRGYAAAVQQNPHADLVALCDPSEAVRRSLADEVGVPVHVDATELLAAHDDLTAAIIATPDATHLAPVMACLDRGLDLMIEKPLATETAQAVEMAEAARRAGVRTLVAFENRWNPKFQSVHQDLRDTGGTMVNQVLTLNDTVMVPTRMLSWAAGSTPGWFLFPHSLDMALWLGGSSPVEVVARGVKQHLVEQGVDTWDAITATFTMADGSLVTLNSQWVLPEGMPSVFDFNVEVNTTRSAYRVTISDSGVRRHDATRTDFLHAPETDLRGRASGLMRSMTDDFVDLLHGAPLDLPDIDHGLLVTAAVAAAHDSLSDGLPRPITIPTSSSTPTLASLTHH